MILSGLVWFKMEKQQQQGQVNPDLFGHLKHEGAHKASAEKSTVTANEQVTNTIT